MHADDKQTPSSWKRVSYYPHTLSPTFLLPPSFFFYSLCPVIPLSAPQHSVKITPTCLKERSHIMSDSRASPGDTRPASKGRVTLARAPPPLALHFTFTSWHYTQDFCFLPLHLIHPTLYNSLSCGPKHVHLKPPPASSPPPSPLNSHGFYFGLVTHHQVNQASWFADNKSREEISLELVKIAVNAFFSTTV